MAVMGYGMGMHKVPKHAIEVPENLTLVSFLQKTETVINS